MIHFFQPLRKKTVLKKSINPTRKDFVDSSYCINEEELTEHSSNEAREMEKLQATSFLEERWIIKISSPMNHRQRTLFGILATKTAIIALENGRYTRGENMIVVDARHF